MIHARAAREVDLTNPLVPRGSALLWVLWVRVALDQHDTPQRRRRVRRSDATVASARSAAPVLDEASLPALEQP